MDAFQSLFKRVREEATPAVWSKGVELVRQESVVGDRESGGEIELRVLTSETGIGSKVSLFLDDEDWSCGCGSTDDPCAHVAAAAIAVRRARESGQPLPKGKAASGRLRHRLTRGSDGLALTRVIEHDGQETVLTTSLTALTSGRVKGPPLAATPEDLEVEVALDGHRQGTLPAKVGPAVIKALAKLPDVTLDGAPVAMDPTPVGLRLEIVDEGPGVKAKGRQDPAIEEVFANRLARTSTGIRPIVLPSLTPIEDRLVKEGRYFAPSELGYLAAEILPGLADKLPIEILTTRLPRATSSKPRLALELVESDGGLVAETLIVYGDPKMAEVRRGLFYTFGKDVPVRDMDEERRLRDESPRRHGLALGEPKRMTAAEAVLFVEALRRPAGTVVLGDGAERFTKHATVVPHVSFDGAGLDVTFTVPGAEARHADAASVMTAWDRGEPLVALLEGGVAPLPKDWLARHGARIAELLAARGDRGEVPPVLRPALLGLAEDLGVTPPPALVAWCAALDQDVETPLPGDLRADLRAYQQVGVQWLLKRRRQGLGALLCDDMGLGKTLQAIASLEGPCLVVAPTSVLHNWRTELARFRPGLSVSVYHGPGRRLDEADVTLTTYAVLRLDAAALTARTWRVVVLDEAQNIKNPDSQAARAAFTVKADFKVALTGTPVENRLLDLWSQMHFANPGLLGARRDFDERFVRRINAGDAAAAALLRERLTPFMLRRLKREVAPELPPRTETVRHAELSDAERAVYDSILLATRTEVVKRLEAGGGVIEALEALLRLRQAACHPALVPGMSGETSAKLTLLGDLLDESVAEGHKTLVFSQWTSFLDLMEPALTARGIPFLRLDGQTVDRAAVVAKFQADDGAPVLLMSLKAGGVGLNLTAADHVVLADPWWNPAAEDQAADRAHRIGQDRPVLVQRLVTLGTVEERILALKDKKREIAAAATGGGTGGAVALTKADLLELLV